MTVFNCLDPKLKLHRHYALEASAGTGKTFAIQHLIARLLIQKIPLDHILVVTFTRAATRELKFRIRSNLANLFQNPPPYIALLSSEEKIEAQFLIKEALSFFDQAQIFTIHGFCKRMLSQFGFEAGINLSFADQKETSYQETLNQTITDFFHTSLYPESYSSKQLHALMKYCNFDKEKLLKNILYFIEQEGKFPCYPDYKTSRNQFLSLNLQIPPVEEFLRLSSAFLKICNKQGVVKQEFYNKLGSQ